MQAGPLPKNVGQLEFKALQTYSDGEVVQWIEPTVKGGDEPEHPAPVLKLTKAKGGDSHYFAAATLPGLPGAPTWPA